MTSTGTLWRKRSCESSALETVKAMQLQSQFERVPLSKERNFSWVFLVDWVLLCVVAVTVIFYLGRLFGHAVTLVLEWFLWRRWKVKISVESLRVAPLSGSILFRNLCIIGKDQTISILKGSIQWRYHLMSTRRSHYEEAASRRDESEEDAGFLRNEKLPSRFVLFCEGLEVFIYNRTVSYDNILRMFSRDERAKFEEFMSKQETSELYHYHSDGTDDKDSTDSVLSSSVTDVPNSNDRVFEEAHNQKKSLFMRFLPMEVELARGSIVLGNKFTPSLLIASYARGRGVIDLCQPKEKLDLYRMQFQVDFTEVDVSMRQNIAYDRKKRSFKNGKLSRIWTSFVDTLHLPFLYRLRIIRDSENERFMNRWKGLTLYKDSAVGKDADSFEEVQFDFINHEYARVSNILKSPRTVLTYAYDIPGVVPHGAHPTLEGPEVGNNGAPPEFGIDLQFHGVALNYGPWAQRQIHHLLRMLSPIVARSSTPVKTLSPGSRRIYTIFKTTFRVLDSSSWRIPTRERSKDSEFLKRFKATSEDYRPFGWLDLKFAKDSYGSVNTVLCPKEEGYPNNMDIHFTEMEAISSVNHDVLLKCNCFDVAGDVGYPLGWNSKATWTVTLSSTQLETFLLREHVTLIADIFTDFSSGEPTPYELFRPFVYNIKWIIHGYSIYLNVNDHNIVNNPLDFNENCYLSLHGEELSIDVTAPNETITGTYMEVPYKITTPMFRLLLNTPPWNTLNEFMKNKEVGRSYNFSVGGLYTVYSELDIDNVDTLSVECTSNGTTLHCYGFVVRYLMNVKMNYFGDFFHFITSEEYTGVIRDKEKEKFSRMEEDSVQDKSEESTDTEGESDPYVRLRGDPPVSRSDVKRNTNETDIWFTFSVWEGALLLPETIYNCDPCVALHFGELIVDLRSCNYYMDLLATMSSTSIKRYVSRQPHELFELIRKDNGRYEKEHGSLTALTIHGHRMYGLPPIEPTYFCQWGIDLDGLDIHSDAEFSKSFFTLFGGIGFGYTNLENTLLYDVETPDDMTSVSVRVHGLNIVIENIENFCRATVEIPDLSFTSIDFENERYSQRLNLKMPNVNISLVVSPPGSEPIHLMDLSTELYLTNFIQRGNFVEHRNKQRDYIALNDSPFYRCAFLLPCYVQESPLYKELLGSISPSSSLPPLPVPLLPETIDFIIEDLLGEFSAALKCDCDTQRPLNEIDSPSQPFDISRESDDTSSPSDERFARTPNLFLPDPQDHHDNIILDIKFVAVDLDPSICSYVNDFFSEFWKVDTIDIIDEIEMSIVKILGQLRNSSAVTNIKLHVMDINLFWGEKSAKGLDLYFDKLDFDFGRRARNVEGESVPIECLMLSKLRSIRATVFDRSITEGVEERPPALSLAVEGWEAYSSIEEKLVGSVNLLSTDITVDESQLGWLSTYITEQRRLLSRMLETFLEQHEYWKSKRRDLLRDITAASESCQINHEPYVITKPAFIMRLSNGHVRENPSWRIITRLRHILTFLPPGWRDSPAISSFTSEDGKNGPVATHWRGWEISDVTRSYIYRTIFSASQCPNSYKTLKKIFKLSFHSFFFTIYSEGYRVAHNFVITRANVSGEEIPLAVLSKKQLDLDYDSVLNLTVSLGAIKGELNDQLLKLRNLFLNTPDPSRKRNKSTINISRSYKLNFFLAFDRSELQFVLYQTRLTNRILNGKATLLLEKLKDSAAPALSFVFFAKRSESWLKHADLVLAEAMSRDLSMTVVAELWTYMPALSVNIQCSSSHVRAMTSTELLVKSVKEISESFEELKRDFDLDHGGPYVNESSNLPIPLQNTSLAISFSNVTAEIMPLAPFVIRQEMKQIAVYMNRVRTNEVLISIWDANFYLKSHQTTEQYFIFSLGDLQVKCNIPDEFNDTLNVALSTSLMKLTLSEPRRILSSFLQDEKLIGKSLEHITELIKLFSPVLSKSSTSSSLKWALDANLNYFGILIPISTTYFVFEVHMLLAALSNTRADHNDAEQHVTGQMSIENCLLLIKEPLLPVELSKLIDFSIRIMSSQKIPNSPQSYQIESSHFRVCLSPESLVQVLWGTHQVQSLFEYFRKHRKQSKALASFFSFDGSASAERQIDFRSIHILSYNLCIGWMFQIDNDVKSGLIIGFDRLFSAYEKNYGKLTLIDGYLSVTSGQSNDNFYSLGDESQRYNRSFLSNVQISYWLKEVDSMKDLFIRVNGEALEVSLLSTSFHLIEDTLASIQKFQTLKNERMHKKENSFKTKLNFENTSNSIAPFLSHIRAIDCQFKYVGGVLKVYSLDDLSKGEGPSLEIKSPGVLVSLSYKHNEAERRSHWIRCLVSIDPTHNILYSQCVPILNDIIDASQRMMQKHAPEENPLESSQRIDYKSLLDSFDIAFKVASGKQQLSLSCEPRAKVQADVGFNSFVFDVSTNDIVEGNPTGVSLYVEMIQSSVRHIFSRETSASFSVNFVNLTSIFTHPDVFAVALISDTNVFFNMKQLQNLNLFLDIWKLNGKFNSKVRGKEEDRKKLSKNPPPTNHGHTPNSINWSFTLIFTSIKGDIDLGPSLGVLSLLMGRTWFATDHYRSQRQVIHAFADELSIESEGRLSGVFDLEGATWIAEINYPEAGSIKASPSMSLSLSVNRVALKTAFDYHMFLIGTADQVRFNLHSESDLYGILPDLLVVNLSCEKIEFCATALTAANILDIYNTIARMRQDNRISYIETLKESNSTEARVALLYEDILQSLNLLRTDLSVDVATLKIQISPISLFDVEVLVLNIDDMSARSETQSGEKLKTELQLHVSNAKLSLSTSSKELDEEALAKISIEDYMLYASKIKGGTIVKIPKLLVSMTTWQKPKSKLIEYLFTCRFYGKVAVKWNLGPINFIKEMWSTHVKSLDVRQAQSSGSNLDANQQPEYGLDEETKAKFQYVPLDEPYIEMPQIKDLGDATPPLEWFGVHRKRLPAGTHQIAIVLIQKLVHAAEKEYAKVQGRSR